MCHLTYDCSKICTINITHPRFYYLFNFPFASLYQVMGQINDRFSQLTNEVTIEVRRQCDNTKQAAADMVKQAAKRTFDVQLELGRQLAEAEFNRQVRIFKFISKVSSFCH